MTGKHVLRALAGTGLLTLAAVSAGAQTQTFVDLEAGLGYSSNPLLQIDGRSSGFGRISARGYHGWGNEKSRTSLSAYAENTRYFRDLGNRQLFALNANSSNQVSETVRLHGELGFSSDFGAQLSSRFLGAPAELRPTPDPVSTGAPVFPEQNVVVVNPDLAAFNQRQYRINGRGGATIVLSPRDYLTSSFGAQRVLFSGANEGLNYSLYDTALGFGRRLNERLSVGVRGIASYADYSLNRSILTYGPQLTAEAQLAEFWQLSGAVGFVRTETDLGALGNKRQSTDLAFDASLCRRLEFENICLGASRRSQSSALVAAPSSTSINASYARRLSAKDQLQASLAIVRTGEAREIGLGRQTFYTAAGSYDRRINNRLSAGVNFAARKLNTFGADPKNDIGGSIFIRNRFGSVR